MRDKTQWLVVGATLWGGVAGFASALFGWGVAGMIVGCSTVALLGAIAARSWIAGPLEDLVAQTRRMASTQRPTHPRHLPQDRRDEIGQLARAIQHVALTAFRDHAEARQLRRTLDQRVEQATRKATAQLTSLALRDPLTNMGNRRLLDQNLDELIRSCRASQTDLICIAIDLDNFKAVNDQLGHATGDELIVFAARLARALVREEDWVVRLGGDEFIVLLPGSNLERAGRFAQQAQMMFSEYATLNLPAELKVSMSMGIASLQRDAPADGPELLKIADEHLYAAKSAGKSTAMGL